MFLVIVLLLAVLEGVAIAQEGWNHVVTNVSAPAREGLASGFSAMDADAAGNVRVVWTEWTTDGVAAVVRTARRARDTGIWSKPLEVFRTTDAYGVVCMQLVMDRDGNAAVSCHTDAADETVTLLVLRYQVATDTWSAEVMDRAVGLLRPYLARDGAGNVFAVWSSTTRTLRLRRLAAGAGTWGPVVGLPFEGLTPLMVADAAGNLFVTWRVLDGPDAIQGAHYDAADDRWSAVSTIPVGEHSIGAVDLALDGTGHVTIVWGQWTTSGVRSAIRSCRYSPVGGWGPVADVAEHPAEFWEPRVVSDDEGNLLAAWYAWLGPARGRIEAATYSAATRNWSAVSPLSPESDAVSWPVVQGDGRGNATVAWLQIHGLISAVRAVRFTRSTGAFTPMVDAAPAHPYLPLLWMTVDPSGAATVLWEEHIGTQVVVQSTRWEPTPAAPIIAWATLEPGVLRLKLMPAQDTEPDFSAINQEYSVNDGPWIPRHPPATTSPVDIRGLPGGTVILRLRAINHVGAGKASEPYSVALSPAPEPPREFAVAAIDRSGVTVRWAAPTGTLPDGYVMEGGAAPGETLVQLPIGNAAPVFTFAAPRGVFYVRLRAFSGVSFSAPSNEVRLVVGDLLPPSAPVDLLGLVDGAALALSWTNTSGGGPAASVRLDVRGAWTGMMAFPPTETLSVRDVPPGTYTVAVTAVNAAGESPSSNLVTLTVPGPCSGPPAPPRNVAAGVSGRTIRLLWDPPASGTAVTGYGVTVGGDATAHVQTSVRVLSGAVPPGLYTLSVVATNPCGTSMPTSPLTVTVH